MQSHEQPLSRSSPPHLRVFHLAHRGRRKATEGRRRKHQTAKRLATWIKSKDWWWLFWWQQAAALYNIAGIKSPLNLVLAVPNCNCVSFLTLWSHERGTFVKSSSRLPFMHAHLNIPLLTINFRKKQYNINFKWPDISFYYLLYIDFASAVHCP